jgi:hypothetical protein
MRKPARIRGCAPARKSVGSEGPLRGLQKISVHSGNTRSQKKTSHPRGVRTADGNHAPRRDQARVERRASARRSDRPVARRLRAPHEKSAGRLVAKTINLLGVVTARIDTDGRWEKQEVFGQQRLDGGRRHGKRCDLFQSKSRNTGAGLLSFSRRVSARVLRAAYQRGGADTLCARAPGTLVV